MSKHTFSITTRISLSFTSLISKYPEKITDSDGKIAMIKLIIEQSNYENENSFKVNDQHNAVKIESTFGNEKSNFILKMSITKKKSEGNEIE